MIDIGIIGASGYTGLELIKILINHPEFNIKYLATSKGGEELSKLHPSLKNVFDISISKADVSKIPSSCKLVFLALPHKTAAAYAKELLKRGIKVVDLSADYRLELDAYEKHYCEHEDKKNLSSAVYGLPELNREKITQANLIANPGCYPTVSLLCILPFIDFIDFDAPIIIDAKSGVSGAGKTPNEGVHFVAVNDNIKSYAPLTHRHAPEIEEKISIASGKSSKVVFVPHLLPMTRGMLSSCYVSLKEEINEKEVLEKFYKNAEFVRIYDEPVNIKTSVGTNFCDIYTKRDGKTLFISGSIDNLLRGASSQAVVNANLMCELDENTGIPSISYAP
ncbi:MAG: N-acetyl-gamma-glutamyl-phosphate reductase (EC [uncultured Campylobacterales bacterium]|uniref:N-acetyl-gamma-glutamyl-phosphate reductase n=1 Tax=uncultured Campylobacterales bacterium TaxID=352960 RepID=A0A6S6STU8_9BACT|nr:MAG: N-acetyl-gamma-glutamyl-phosphate reductase (EC [uncultured Campylobacterales bacterium]